jgi:hypothetical protein
MTNREVEIINLTPHEITVVASNGDVLMKIPASGNVARCSVSRTVIGKLNGIPVAKSVMGQVESMPEPKEGVVFIVSRVVAEALKGVRDDLIIPDDSVRDAEGKIIGCKGFAVV